MSSKGKPLFDLNEPAAEEDEESDGVFCFQPQRAVPSTTHTSDLFTTSNSPRRIINNNAFSHASSVSGFQPFVRSKGSQAPEVSEDQKREIDIGSVIEKEEGEWSDAEGSADANKSSSVPDKSTSAHDDKSQVKAMAALMDQRDSDVAAVVNTSSNVYDVKDENSNHASLGVDADSIDRKSSGSRNSEGDIAMDSQEDSTMAPKQRDIRGAEAIHALKLANNPGKRPKFDQQKEAMLGKKRSRQTMFLNLEDVKQVGTIKTSTPRRQNFPPPVTTRIVKESRPLSASTERSGDKQIQPPMMRDAKQVDQSCNESSSYLESGDPRSECNNGDINSGPVARPKRSISGIDLAAEDKPLPNHRQSILKQTTDSRQTKNAQLPGRKTALVNQNSSDPKAGGKKLPSKKPLTITTPQYQDTSVERLLREVTNEKFWQHPEEAELQCVPGSFESVEEYIRVFEPLLFEECRAQLYSTWEELTETASRDLHAMVRIRSVERRERGWYDVILLPANECRWNFKEGDVAVLSTPRPGTVISKRNNSSITGEEAEISGRVAGTVRRHIPIDTRDPTGAILHFYVGDSYDSSSKVDDDHILRKLHPKGIWFLTVLGSLATTQREYIALHAFRRLNSQMQTAILQPSPELFPKYEEQAPAMPDCFTPNFVDYLHKTFNGPQLSAIHWAATHTAAGTTNGLTKRQEPWPFTLVQGPPGTGKTHTVWGMLNVIHLVQYQHYYTALLKKLAPESYKQATESLSSESAPIGSIDEVLQNMDQNLFRTLHKLCPKPRMLVCAPSNAATDELLTRVLDRGFIDGEMKVYRPDVARVGVDTQTRAAQAVSVERRTEQLLMKSRDEVYGWMHQLRGREAQLSQQIASLQRELNVAAFTGRSQGSVGVDPEVLVARDQSRDSLLQNLAAVVENRDKVLVEMSRLFILEGRFRSGGNFNLEEARASLEASFANEAEVVFTTVSSSGRKLFSRLTHGFDMVVIDEAAQASEVGVLPPLALGAARCVLVGDPQQLPATVISKAAGTLLYSRSLFERFQQAGCPTMLLSVQYRMHPQIREFPSRYFYQGRLTDSESVMNLADEVYYKDPLLRPYIFYDITHGRESHRGGSVSYQNIHEAQFCLRLYQHLQKSVKSLGIAKVSVGIITPYKLQLKCIQREFEEVLKSEEGKDLYVNTVDAFQGQERDVIIMSCVRASNHGVGFVADIRRMNVALTRAKRALWVMGNASTLVQSDDWAALIADAKTRECYMDMDSLPKDFLAPKVSPPVYGPPQARFSNMRGLKRPGLRHRSYDHMESRSGTPSEDDEKTNSSFAPRNGNYRPFKPPTENNSLDDFDQSGDRSRDAWQHGIQKRPNSTPVTGKRDP
ncbi:helicase sen1 [Cynara cardunculus var. scolymus]|uniref:Putative helicase MAGATAMA 3 n=1 Tax=Cynara cardunculus var. scolymus TaxID=59895 RepID=A0A103XXA3_CYNCS|nr:helicase sen1 [Cynara cardunculus var. scolymus]KVH98564.1 putative helicase MAGATAMA 3 [Cynara cardunculus var. scolymus]